MSYPRSPFACLRQGALAGFCLLVVVSSAISQPATPRVVPNTNFGVHVWNDQLLARNMTDAQIAFAATHYDGSQKILRGYADRFRAFNPNFLILHYRLGQMLGYRSAQGTCQPAGDLTRIIEGDQWIIEYPGDQVVQDSWFYHYSGSSRVYYCSWGAWLMDTDDPGWRGYWFGEVNRQLAANDDDGVFMDATSVPNYLGVFSPSFPAVDISFETQWSARIRRWLVEVKRQFGSRYLLIPNTGHWVTTRDVTDYSPADGVLIEGFGKWDQYTALELIDWQLQMNRILGLERQNKIIIAQSYLDGPEDLVTRNYFIANYLLIKGAHTFVNLELGLDPEWFPEYEIPIGAPLDILPSDVDGWRDPATGLYRRYYSNGLVVVNPTGTTRTLNLGKNYYLVNASGGGYLPSTGIPTGALSYQPTSSVTLAPSTAAILISSTGSSVATVSAADYSSPIVAGESIAAAFGANLSSGTAAASGLPLPTTLAGSSVTVRDSANQERAAGLFYVSPTQINYQVPAGLAGGRAIVSVYSAGTVVATGNIQIVATAPGLFTANATGQGLAAAQVQRIRGGSSTFESVAGYDLTLKKFVALPVDLSPLTDQVYLVLYGTGIRNRSSLQTVSAQIDGIAANVAYAGAQGGYVGVDQVNVQVPATLAGQGEVNVVLTVDGQSANTVKFSIK